MSERNVEIIRRGFEQFLGGEVEKAIQIFTADAVIRRTEPEALEWRGPQGMIAVVADWTEGFESFETTAEEFVDAGDRVLVRTHQRGRGAASGVQVDADFWFVYTLRDELVTRLEIFADRTKALAAAGLDP